MTNSRKWKHTCKKKHIYKWQDLRIMLPNSEFCMVFLGFSTRREMWPHLLPWKGQESAPSFSHKLYPSDIAPHMNRWCITTPRRWWSVVLRTAPSASLNLSCFKTSKERNMSQQEDHWKDTSKKNSPYLITGYIGNTLRYRGDICIYIYVYTVYGDEWESHYNIGILQWRILNIVTRMILLCLTNQKKKHRIKKQVFIVLHLEHFYFQGCTLWVKQS